MSNLVCSFPHATSHTLLAKFKQQHEDNKYFLGTPVLEPAFIIQHFAGRVKYQIKVGAAPHPRCALGPFAATQWGLHMLGMLGLTPTLSASPWAPRGDRPLPPHQDFREKNMDYMRPDIVALLRGSDSSYVRQLIGMDPVAVFRWAVLRAAIRAMAVLREAGRLRAERAEKAAGRG